MARMDAQTNLLTSAAWCGDFIDEDALMPGGGRVDPATVTADANGYKTIPSGSLVGRTIAQRTAGAVFHMAVDTDEEIFIVAFDVTDALKKADVELYRPSAVVKENFLPNFGTLSVALLAKVRSTYITTRGAN